VAVDEGLADEVYVPPAKDAPASALAPPSGAPTPHATTDVAAIVAAELERLGIHQSPSVTDGSPAGGSPVPEDAAALVLAAFSPSGGNHDE
jgi:hypothetical protein